MNEPKRIEICLPSINFGLIQSTILILVIKIYIIVLSLSIIILKDYGSTFLAMDYLYYMRSVLILLMVMIFVFLADFVFVLVYHIVKWLYNKRKEGKYTLK